jgi:tRNA U55 pseudouridine synthase TruB
MIIVVDKPIGWTMYQLIQHHRKKYPNEKISFAGRLDPIAFGKVKLLVGKEDVRKNISETWCDKRYKFKLICGIKTDTFDILGLAKIEDLTRIPTSILVGKHLQEYPPYSSVIISEYKMPYWQCTKRGLPVKNRPTREIIIHELQETKRNNRKLKANDLLNMIINRINLVSMITFRQEEIIERWKKLLIGLETEIRVIEYETIISSGGYVRWICEQMNGCAMDIERLEFIE